MFVNNGLQAALLRLSGFCASARKRQGRVEKLLQLLLLTLASRIPLYNHRPPQPCLKPYHVGRIKTK